MNRKKESLCWIKTIPPEEAEGELLDVYGEVASPLGNIDFIYQSQSLCPESIRGHDVLYRGVLHTPDSVIPGWFLEAVAVYTSVLNKSSYAIAHHSANMAFLHGDKVESEKILDAIRSDSPKCYFKGKWLAFMQYARKLTVTPSEMEREDVEALRRENALDKEILEINQVVACFNYSNRVINGLGIQLGDEPIGFYDP